MTKRRRLIVLCACGAGLALSMTGCVDAVTYNSFLCRVNGGFPEEGGGNVVYCSFADGQPPQQAKPVRPAGGGRVDPFTVRFKSRVVANGRRRGRQVTGVKHKGTVRISPRGSAKRLLRGYTRARYASSGSLRAGGRNGLGRLQGYMWVRFTRGRGAACLRVDAQVISVDGPPSAVAQLRSVGGTGRAARLAVVGSAPLSGGDRVNGTWQVRRAKARRAPAACRRLARIR
jgi:hypothetical protein